MYEINAWKKFFSQSWLLGGIGVLFLLLSVILDQGLLLDGHVNESTLWYRNPFVLVELLRETGFAAIIALVVSTLVERTARIEQQERTNSDLQKISKNVIAATFGLQIPNRIVNNVIYSVLSSKIIRSRMKVTFILLDIPEEVEIKHGIPKGKFRILQMQSDSEMTNVSATAIDHPIRLFVPIIDSTLNHLVGLRSGSIGSEKLSEALIRQGSEAIPDTAYEKRYEWSRRIAPMETIRVAFNYQLLKEISDNEVWTSLLPTENLEVTVDIQCNDVEWGLDARCMGQFRPAYDPLNEVFDVDPDSAPKRSGRFRFTPIDTLLPYQGMTLWWRPARNIPVGPVPAASMREAFE